MYGQEKKKKVWYNVLQVAFNFCVTHAFVIHGHEIMNFIAELSITV